MCVKTLLLSFALVQTITFSNVDAFSCYEGSGTRSKLSLEVQECSSVHCRVITDANGFIRHSCMNPQLGNEPVHVGCRQVKGKEQECICSTELCNDKNFTEGRGGKHVAGVWTIVFAFGVSVAAWMSRRE